MFDEKAYKEIFSQITVSEGTYQEVMEMADRRKERKTVNGRRLAVLTAAVLLLMAMTLTVFASEDIANWFRNYFTQNSGAPLSPEQADYIEESVQDVCMSRTHNGYTLTVESALTDGFSAFLKLTLRGPEGVTLNADDYGYTYKGKPIFYPADGSNPTRSGTWRMSEWRNLEDADTEDNEVSILYTAQGSGFDAGSKWILELEDLTAGYLQEDGFYQDTVIAEGVFRYELVLTDSEGEEMQLLPQPMEYTARVYVSESEYEEVEVTLTSFILRPLSADLLFKSNVDAASLAGFGQLCVVMEDGSSVKMDLAMGGNGYIRYFPDEPIAVREADYLLLPDGMRIEVPD